MMLKYIRKFFSNAREIPHSYQCKLLSLVAFCIFGMLLFSFLQNEQNYSFSDTCTMTTKPSGWSRLGKHMFLYSALYTLARNHDCEAILSPGTAQIFHGCFNVSMKSNDRLYKSDKWTPRKIPLILADDYFTEKNMPKMVRLTNFTRDWQYVQTYAADLLREFQFMPDVNLVAEKFLHTIRHKQKRSTVTYIGIHVRRYDYVPYLKKRGCLPATKQYILKAMQIFHDKYPDTLFVLASDDMDWCLKNIVLGTHLKVALVDPNYDSCTTMAILSQCNHSIITHGTFGFWSAYLGEGDVVYFADNCSSAFYMDKYAVMHPPHWFKLS